MTAVTCCLFNFAHFSILILNPHLGHYPGQLALFPIRLDDAVMETDQAWAASLRRNRHIGDFRAWKDHDPYQKLFDRLLRDLKAQRRAAEPQPKCAMAILAMPEHGRDARGPGSPHRPLSRARVNLAATDSKLRWSKNRFPFFPRRDSTWLHCLRID